MNVLKNKKKTKLSWLKPSFKSACQEKQLNTK